MECLRSKTPPCCSDGSLFSCIELARGDVCNALDGRGETSPGLWPTRGTFWGDSCVDMVSLGVVETTTLQDGLHRGDIVVFFFPSTFDPLGG